MTQKYRISFISNFLKIRFIIILLTKSFETQNNIKFITNKILIIM